MDMDTNPEPLEGVFPLLPTPADEQHPPGSSDEDDSNSGEGGRGAGAHVDLLPALDIDHDLDEHEEPLEIPTGYACSGEPSACHTHQGTRDKGR